MEHNYFNIHYENCSFCFIIQKLWLLSLEQQYRKIPTGTDGQVTASGYYPLWGSCINHTNDQLKAETYINNQYGCIIYRAKTPHGSLIFALVYCDWISFAHDLAGFWKGGSFCFQGQHLFKLLLSAVHYLFRGEGCYLCTSW